MMRKKVDYIHFNPDEQPRRKLRGIEPVEIKRGYVDKAEYWRYSSAKDYLGQRELLEVCTQCN